LLFLQLDDVLETHPLPPLDGPSAESARAGTDAARVGIPAPLLSFKDPVEIPFEF
jgi:hypothetical protein